MKLSLLKLGKGAENPFAFTVIDAEGDVHEVSCLLRALDGAEEAEVIRFATEYARANGKPDAKEGDPLWDLGYMVKTIHLSCLDPDSPKLARTPAFDTGTDLVLSLPRETITYIFEAQQFWQDQVSPTVKRMGANELLDRVREIAEADDDRPFLRLSPALRWICMRSMAVLLLKSHEDSLLASLSTAKSGQTSSAPAQTNGPESSATEPPQSEASHAPVPIR